MSQESVVNNPFMLLIEPEQVIAAMHGSQVLERLSRRMCHPLDKPQLIPGQASDAGDGRGIDPGHRHDH